MTERYFISVLLWTAVLFAACGNGTVKEERKKGKPHFELPVVPAVLVSREEQMTFLVAHYWDRFDFTDTVLLRDAEVTEQAFVNYLQLLGQVPEEVSDKSIGFLLGQAWRADQATKTEKSTLSPCYWQNPRFDYFTGQFSHYLYDPNSPYRSEELYTVVLKQIIAMPEVPDLLKERSRYEYGKALKNRVGDPASDFRYMTVAGQEQSLYSLKASYILLFFYDPDCPGCRETEGWLAASPVIEKMVKKKQLILLALCVGEDTSGWRPHLRAMPAGWLHACDPVREIKNRELYDLRAIPSLYLLDRNKRVVLKDARFLQLENRLLGAAEDMVRNEEIRL